MIANHNANDTGASEVQKETSTESRSFETQNLNYKDVDASLVRRVMAFFLDSLVLAIPVAIGSMIFPFVGGFLVWLVYAPILEASDLRATIGKYWMGIQVADDQSRKITFKSALLRNLFKLVSTGLLLLGFVVAFFSKRKQTLHDLLAETYVVYGRNELNIADAWTRAFKEIWNGHSPTREEATYFNETHDPSSKSPMYSVTRSSFVTELEKLNDLKMKGSLTEEEFSAAKKKLLGL